MIITRFCPVADDNAVDRSRALSEECARELGFHGSLRHRCPACGGVDHGRPLIYLTNVSLSRAPSMVLAAVSDSGPVGVDIERAGAVPAAMSRKIISDFDTETDLTRLWVAKEAAAKYWGWGLRLDFRKLAVQSESVRWFSRTGFTCNTANSPDLPGRDTGVERGTQLIADLVAALTWLDAPDGYLAALVSDRPISESRA